MEARSVTLDEKVAYMEGEIRVLLILCTMQLGATLGLISYVFH